MFAVMSHPCSAKELIRDGSSFERAIIVPPDLPDEIAWEMRQIRKFHPDANLGPAEQGLVPHGGRMYDVYDMRSLDGKKRIITYFDIGTEKDFR